MTEPKKPAVPPTDSGEARQDLPAGVESTEVPSIMITDHAYVYGGYEVGSGSAIECLICGADVAEHATTEESSTCKQSLQVPPGEARQDAGRQAKVVCTCIAEGSGRCQYPHPCRNCGQSKHVGVSCYWNSHGKTSADRKPGRTFIRSDGSLGCSECCNGDRCDDPTHYDRENCPFCLGSGSGIEGVMPAEKPDSPQFAPASPASDAPQGAREWLPSRMFADWYDAAEQYAAYVRQWDAQTIAAKNAQLAECYRLSGADPDGNEDWRLAGYAVQEVKRLREDSDTADREIVAKDAEIARQFSLIQDLATKWQTFEKEAALFRGLAENSEQRAGALTAALNGYDLKRYAHTFRRMREGLAEAVLLVNGMIERDSGLVEHWRLLAQTCDADHLTTCANKLDAAIRKEEK